MCGFFLGILWWVECFTHRVLGVVLDGVLYLSVGTVVDVGRTVVPPEPREDGGSYRSQLEKENKENLLSEKLARHEFQEIYPLHQRHQTTSIPCRCISSSQCHANAFVCKWQRLKVGEKKKQNNNRPLYTHPVHRDCNDLVLQNKKMAGSFYVRCARAGLWSVFPATLPHLLAPVKQRGTRCVLLLSVGFISLCLQLKCFFIHAWMHDRVGDHVRRVPLKTRASFVWVFDFGE